MEQKSDLCHNEKKSEVVLPNDRRRWHPIAAEECRDLPQAAVTPWADER